MSYGYTYHFLVLLLLSVSHQLNAQWYPGVTAGYQITNLANKTNDSQWNPGSGWRAGAFIDRPFRKSQFGMRVETAYALIRANDKTANRIYSVSYLSMPVSLLYMPVEQVQFFIGPQFNFLLRQKDKSSIGMFNNIDAGVHASFEMIFIPRLSVAFRYYQGLTYNTTDKDPLSGQTRYNNRISAIQLCLNYFLNVNGEGKQHVR